MAKHDSEPLGLDYNAYEASLAREAAAEAMDREDDFGGFVSAEAEAADFEWLCEAAEGAALLDEMLADDFGGDLGDFGASE